MKGRASLAGFVLAALLVWAPAALAQDSTDGSPVDQYTDDIPTAGGSTGDDSGSEGSRGADGYQLPPDVADELGSEAGGDAAILKEIATSPARGAPQHKPAEEPAPNISPQEPNAVSAATSAFADDGGAQLESLLAVLIGIGAIGVVAVVWRARRNRA
jgi:hypothetical protein